MFEMKPASAAQTQPAVTPEDVISEHYFTAADGCYAAEISRLIAAGCVLDAESVRPAPKELGRLTFCVLVLRNGAVVTGEARTVGDGAEDVDPALVRQVARKSAISRIGGAQ